MMRGLSLIGVVIALLIVGLLMRKQLRTDDPAQAPTSITTTDPSEMAPIQTPAQSRRVEAQVRESLDKALQARPVQDD